MYIYVRFFYFAALPIIMLFFLYKKSMCYLVYLHLEILKIKWYRGN